MATDEAARLLALFAGNEDFCGTHGEPQWDEEKGKWSIHSSARTLADRVSLQHWEVHLSGERPLGVAPTRRDSSCLWGSIDVDDYAVDALAVARRIELAHLPLLPCRSKSGGLHLFLFLAAAEPARAVQAALRDAAAQMGLAESEIFPKQSELHTDRGDQPNWMVMPYFGALGPPGAGTFGERLREQYGVKPSGGEMTLGEFLRAAEAARTSLRDFRPRRPRVPAATAPSEPPARGDAFADGPPCLQHLATTGVQRGGQNNALFMMGIYYRRAYPDDWKARLEEAAARYLDPPGTVEGVSGVTASLSRDKEYFYTCKKEPMVGFCNVAVCRGREFGVGEAGQYPLIGSISRYGRDPPRWFVDVEGVRVMCSTEQLQNYVHFHRLCMERTDRVYSAMKQGDWLELLTEFLTDRTRGKRWDELLGDRPFEDVDGEWGRRVRGAHYLTLRGLMAHLHREDFREMRRPEVTQRLRDLGGGHYQANIKGRTCNTWWVPGSALAPKPPLPVPRAEEGPL